jgi:hypothetical protein
MPDKARLQVKTNADPEVWEDVGSAGTTLPTSLPTGAATSANQTNGTQISQILGKTGDTTFQSPRIDVATHSLQTIDYAHHEIHSGSHFFVSGVATLPLNDVLDFTWVMPNTTKWVHWLWKIDASAETAWYVYENAVITNALANTITPLNNNRNSLATSGTTMKYEIQADLAAANVDTDVATATLLKSGILGAGKSGGSDSRESELILKQGATYCLRAVATAAGYIDFNMEWYEHTNKTA